MRCANIDFKDGYGATLPRSSACYDSEASVVVIVTDTCPCVYPANAVGNKRWWWVAAGCMHCPLLACWPAADVRRSID